MDLIGKRSQVCCFLPLFQHRRILIKNAGSVTRVAALMSQPSGREAAADRAIKQW
jgi:hypothetical protein